MEEECEGAFYLAGEAKHKSGSEVTTIIGYEYLIGFPFSYSMFAHILMSFTNLKGLCIDQYWKVVYKMWGNETLAHV